MTRAEVRGSKEAGALTIAILILPAENGPLASCAPAERGGELMSAS